MPSSTEEVERTSKRVPRRVEFAKTGDLFVVSKQDEGEETPEVRMFGIVMKPEIPDVEGDVTSEEEITSANDEFMRDFGTLGFMHKKDVSDKVKILQNVIAPVDFDFPLSDGSTKSIAKGTWYQELFSNDAEIVERVRNEQITGLSIGGFARRVPITEMLDGALSVVVPESYTRAMKRAIEEVVAKAEGDPALARFVDLRVEEISLVDAAANEEVFFIIKRRKEMPGKDKPAAGGAQTSTPPTSPTIAEQVTAGVTAGVTAAFKGLIDEGLITSASATETPATTETPAPVATETPAPATETPVAPVTKGVESSAVLEAIGKIGERLDGIETTQKAQDAKIEEANRVRAVAKGASAPDDTETAGDDDDASVSKWAGTSIHNVSRRTSGFGAGRGSGR